MGLADSLGRDPVPRLEAKVHGCRIQGREFPMHMSLFVQIRALGIAYFRVRAGALRPMLALLGDSDLDNHAKVIVRSYMAQATAFPLAWDHVEGLIQNGAKEHGRESAQAENAARVTMARALLIALLQGQARNWATTEMVLAHGTHTPSAALK